MVTKYWKNVWFQEIKLKNLFLYNLEASNAGCPQDLFSFKNLRDLRKP